MSTDNVYKAKDVVKVSRGSEEDGTYQEQEVPKRWLGTDLLESDWKQVGGKSSSSSSDDVEIPEGDPSEEWTHKQLDAYAAAQQPPVNVSGISNKADKIAAINKASVV